MSTRALITGITGQDGSYLAELLLEKGYDVHALVRRASTTNFWRIEHLLDRIHLHAGDLLDQLSLIKVLDDVQPRELYNLAAMSFVPASWDQPMLTGECSKPCDRSIPPSGFIRRRLRKCSGRCGKCRRPS
jgi:GDPmannose 4,6-dehydratase